MEEEPQQSERKLKEIKERLVRWEDNRRKQLGVTNNIVLGLSTGLLGFLASYLNDKSRDAYLDFAMYFLFASVALAILVSFIRLYDFRRTVQVIYLEKEELEKQIDHGLKKEMLRKCTRRLGNWTWGLLIAQVTLFLIGVFYATVLL